MNKKGFTLIEIIAVVSILAIIAIISVPKIIDTIQASRQKMYKEQESRLVQAASEYLADEYVEEGFADFTLRYPGHWEVNHWEDGVKFSSADGKEYLMVFVQKMGHPVLEENISTTTFFNYPARRLQDSGLKGDGSDESYDVLEVYPEGYKKTEEIIEIRSNGGKLDELLKNISEFKVK